jgi:hypothetical protein
MEFGWQYKSARLARCYSSYDRPRHRTMKIHNQKKIQDYGKDCVTEMMEKIYRE